MLKIVEAKRFKVSLTSSSWCCGSCGRGSSDTRSDVRDQVLDINAFKGLGEEARPVWLNFNVGSLQESGELFTLETGINI